MSTFKPSSELRPSGPPLWQLPMVQRLAMGLCQSMVQRLAMDQCPPSSQRRDLGPAVLHFDSCPWSIVWPWVYVSPWSNVRPWTNVCLQVNIGIWRPPAFYADLFLTTHGRKWPWVKVSPWLEVAMDQCPPSSQRRILKATSVLRRPLFWLPMVESGHGSWSVHGRNSHGPMSAFKSIGIWRPPTFFSGPLLTTHGRKWPWVNVSPWFQSLAMDQCLLSSQCRILGPRFPTFFQWTSSLTTHGRKWPWVNVIPWSKSGHRPTSGL